ncbi:hypothetical protein KY331_01710 [Candidatus Woesearchaeota archaeon]|nr:hypothetical protein [Candidatus Woesearchaeota archaeon]
MAEKSKTDIMKIVEVVFGVIFIIYGLLSLAVNVLGGLLLLVGGIFIIPPVRKFIDKQYNVKLYSWLKWVIFIILVGLGYSLVR